jgi:uncharacterized protein (TIGR00369 family)
MDPNQVDALLEQVLAPWVKALGLRAERVDATQATLLLPFAEASRHAGGVICGQVFMAAADTAMMVAIAAALGGFRPMTTVTLNTSFMRAVRGGDVRVTARVLRAGQNLIFGEVELHDEAGRLAVHATTTYALLNTEPVHV